MRALPIVFCWLLTSAAFGDALSDAGLSKVGNAYLLDLDQHLNDHLKEIAAAEQANQALAHKRAALQSDSAQANAEIETLKAQVADLEDRRSRISEKARDSRKFLEDQAKALNAQIKADQQQVDKNKSDSDALKVVDVGALNIKLADDMDVVADQYTQLANDASVQTAIISASSGGPRLKLGPSAFFAQQLPRARAARDRARGKTAPLKTIPSTPAAAPTSAAVQSTLRINLSVNSHETIEINKAGLRLVHESGPLPTGVIVNGVPWDVSSSTSLPAGSSTAFLDTANFASAHVTEKSGRGTLNFTVANDGLKVDIADANPGAGDYAVTIAMESK